MADFYGGSSASDFYGGGGGRVGKLPKNTDRRSALGKLLGGIASVGGNLVSDVENTATGLGPGIASAVNDPGAAVHALLHDYATRYSPLVHGNFGKFFHQIGQHPLSYLLDATAVLDAPGALAGRAALSGRVLAAAEAGSPVARALVESASPTTTTLRLAKGGESTVPKLLTGRPVGRLRQRAITSAQKSLLPHGTPVIGEGAAARRALISHAREVEARLAAHEPQYAKAMLPVVKSHARTRALDAILRGVLPTQELQFLKDTAWEQPLEKTTLQDLSNPELHRIVNETVAARRGEGPMTKDAAAVIHAYEAHAKLLRDTHAAMLAHAKDPEALAAILRQRAVLHHVVMDRILGHAPKNVADPELHAMQYASAIERKTGFKPLYTPDTYIFGSSGSRAARNKATLFEHGERQPHPQHALNQHVGTSRWVAALRHRAMLEQHARVVPEGEPLRKNEVWLAKHAINEKDFIAAHAEQHATELKAMSEGNAHQVADLYRQALQGDAKNNARLAVPRSLMNEVAARAGREAGTVSSMLDKGTQWWKRWVLAFSPARFIIGNVGGNQILAALHGIGLKSFHDARLEHNLYETHFSHPNDTFGQSERFLMRKGQNKLSRGYDRAANLGFHVVGAHEGIIRRATMVKALRQIPAVRNELQRVQRLTREGKLTLDQGVSPLHKAYEMAVQRHPAQPIQQEVQSIIDDVSGNYRHYNAFERELKKLIPFYGWSRHALRSYYRLIANHPATADAVTQLGTLGEAYNAHQYPGVPDFMRSYVSANLPFGLGNTLDTRNINPLSTAGDTTAALAQLVGGKPGQAKQVGAQLNPLVAGFIQALTNQSLLTGAPVKQKSGLGVLGNILTQTVETLPQYKIVASQLPPKYGGSAQDLSDPHSLYTPTGQPKQPSQHVLGASTAQLLAQFLGAQNRDVNVPLAQAWEQRLKQKQNTQFHPASSRKRKSSPGFYG